uniref:Uncharacterized protein n=1 Tax=Fagus sylvatica TaxID=28930 RepID=A0A2N9HF42_FAGSY
MWSISDRSAELRRAGSCFRDILAGHGLWKRTRTSKVPGKSGRLTFIEFVAISGLVSVPTSPQTPSPSNSQTRQGKKTPEYGVLAREPRFGSVYAETM